MRIKRPVLAAAAWTLFGALCVPLLRAASWPPALPDLSPSGPALRAGKAYAPSEEDAQSPGRALLDEIGRQASSGFIPHPYESTRFQLFSVIDNVEVAGQRGVVDVYSDIFVPGSSGDGGRYPENGDRNGDGYEDTGMNVEHLWPQSMFQGHSPMRSDVHHLLPSFMHPNSVRGNLPFGDVTGRVEYENIAGARMGGGLFEPPDSAKGRVARALFYFYARYRDAGIFDGEGKERFWNERLPTLLAWNRAFPPDPRERSRNDAAQRFQGNRNPFIDDPRLADRVGLAGFGRP